MPWVVEGVKCWFVAGSPGFVESSGKTSHTVSHSFSISASICLWSAWKREVVNVVEVFTNKSVEVWGETEAWYILTRGAGVQVKKGCCVKMGSVIECGRLTSVEYSGRLATRISSACAVRETQVWR